MFSRARQSSLIVACFCSIILLVSLSIIFFFFNDTPTTEIYTLSLHDALPIFAGVRGEDVEREAVRLFGPEGRAVVGGEIGKHTSELQSHSDLVCRLLLEKKKKKKKSKNKTNKK